VRFQHAGQIAHIHRRYAFLVQPFVYTSLADTRPVTTPALLAVLVRNGRLGPDGAAEALDRIAAARSWDGDAYVERARRLLDGG
jgi:hypothetical protein